MDVATVAYSIDALGDDFNSISSLSMFIMAGNVLGADSAGLPLWYLLQTGAIFLRVLRGEPLGQSISSSEL
jgi:hypothetical protein